MSCKTKIVFGIFQIHADMHYIDACHSCHLFAKKMSPKSNVSLVSCLVFCHRWSIIRFGNRYSMTQWWIGYCTLNHPDYLHESKPQVSNPFSPSGTAGLYFTIDNITINVTKSTINSNQMTFHIINILYTFTETIMGFVSDSCYEVDSEF